MNVKINENKILTDFILDYADRTLSKAEERSFTELMANFPKLRKQAVCNWYIRSAFKRLKPVKARDGFEQKMAAVFAGELEREVSQLNMKNLSKDTFIES